MCGIIGCIHKSNFKFSINNFSEINQSLSHRGPDSEGVDQFNLGDNIFKIGHKRLSILDLSENGHQPMHSNTNRFTISFNGEIYNHFELRKKYLYNKNIVWKGFSDTETLINLFDFYEFEQVLKLIDGMFAFILYDKKDGCIYLVRDRAGEKPLYITSTNQLIAFSSDIKSLKQLNGFNKNINTDALKKFLNLNYIPSPLSIYESTYKLPAASFIKIITSKIGYSNTNSFNAFISNDFIKYDKWFSIQNSTTSIKSNNKDEYYIERGEEILNKSVKSQLLSDVPLGAFLSGGIDSSLIVALMQQNQSQTKTFTIGYKDFKEIDETEDALKVSNYLSTDHTSYEFSNKEIISTIPLIQSTFSEPFADSSQLPTLLVSKIAKEKVKVILSGDGGDELFGGYNRYLYANKFFKYIFVLNPKIKNILLSLIKIMPLNILLKALNLLIFTSKSFKINITQLYKILNKMQHINDYKSYYNSFTNEWFNDDNLFLFKQSDKYDFISTNTFNDDFRDEEKMMFLDFLTYLPDDILCKVDRSTMNFSLEARSPFLSKNVIDFSNSIPFHLKINDGNTKVILKKILSKKIPPNFLNKSKKGFASPIGYLIKNELKNWSNEILNKDNFSKHNLLNFEIVNKIKNEHFNGKNDHQYKLWSLIQFTQWYSANC